MQPISQVVFIICKQDNIKEKFTCHSDDFSRLVRQTVDDIIIDLVFHFHFSRNYEALLDFRRKEIENRIKGFREEFYGVCSCSKKGFSCSGVFHRK